MSTQALQKKPAVHTVRLEPVGLEMEVEEGETILDAAFRQGVSLMHGCKEGQCSACKCLLIDGDVEMLKYSTFALSDPERDSNHILLCRTVAYSDVEVELLNYDEDLLARSIPVKDIAGRLAAVETLTHDIVAIAVTLDQPMKFWAGQYVDITLPGHGITRSFSMANPPGANPPGGPARLEFIIKKYPQGAFSGALDDGLAVGEPVMVRGPYGTCFRREEREGPMILVGGGSGMAPLLSILHDQAASGETRPVRFFYGARTRRDLFHLELFEAFARAMPDFAFIPALSHAGDEDGWTGETGFVHEVLRRHLAAMPDVEQADVYSCGPPPMIDAVLPVLQMAGVDSARIHFDKFTPATR
ncbi:2Fe-2S iron-sulfur cluster binding domain-containing protein [Azospirillum sp. RWY-5-1]|uniref:2Fe-2S iron-sulfur cluster binding domain-containing protein n=1 Tax=Azospirillum oleiclasticum TaxID=2735135 RepID=A0ABX2T932_9PROT|nr:2Fe-2S iron-sulfur cluster-binding protein [Azospirillum oleiclasticum]NYZ13907.1 2Fe-2S iron-sulfur cluster binding domain-containing protein [Azospirillum oleiclasticum]NYZ20831.1 2Fe-2S iron-sulfur cluster binding domain-containing protein [Azospirillum oleiclasticum]